MCVFLLSLDCLDLIICSIGKEVRLCKDSKSFFLKKWAAEASATYFVLDFVRNHLKFEKFISFWL